MRPLTLSTVFHLTTKLNLDDHLNSRGSITEDNDPLLIVARVFAVKGIYL